jgi:hypothetical protein
MARTKGITPQESIADAVASLDEKRQQGDLVLMEHFEKTSKWMETLFSSCKRKILQGSDVDILKAKKAKLETAFVAAVDKENSKPSVVYSINKNVKVKQQEAEPGIKHPRYDEIMAMKVTELRKEIKSLRLEGTGLKRDLQQRLLDHLSSADDESEPEDDQDAGTNEDEVRVAVSDVPVKSPDVKRMSTDSIKDAVMEDVAEEKVTEGMDAEVKIVEQAQTEIASVPTKSRVQMAVAQKEETIAKLKEQVNASDTSSRKNQVVFGVQSFVKNAVRAMSPNKRPNDASQVDASSKAVPASNTSARTAIKQTLVRAASTFMATNSKSEVSTVPVSEKPALSTESKSSFDSGFSVQSKIQQAAEARKQRLADMRGKSKPVALATAPKTQIAPLSTSKLLNKSATASKSGLDLKKTTLASKMREKHATLQTQSVSSQPPSSSMKSTPTPIRSAGVFEAKSGNSQIENENTLKTSTEVVSEANVVNPPPCVESAPDARQTKTPAAAQAESLKKARSPMDTYEISDRDESDSESDSDEEDESKAKKKVRACRVPAYDCASYSSSLTATFKSDSRLGSKVESS